MVKKGKLIGIGVGPGDTELLTLKAAKVLEKVPVIFSPKSAKEKESIALSIVRPILKERKDYKKIMIVEPIFPMIEDKKELEKIWDSASELVAQYLNTGRDVAFITLGDTSIFSTYSYLQKRLMDRYEIETIPGITSFTACAAAKNEALVEQNDILTIVPKIDSRIENILEYTDSIVLMKASRNSTKLELKIKNDKREKEIYSVQNCTRENEKIIEGFSHEKPYLTTSIIKFKDD
ncbi:precorrin-2/cobalt-factor-2 C20-methyltransferase [Methanobrevibacter gottschalkii]|uniref:Precorrin-2/cobalt-factor-2 C20-methyltransferase n=2 Tax=Methanobrevibacter gottschalkii TaxID=190974 RepID=A0A3N5C456_9EURY|nr:MULTISPECIES: precorrin-2 C(20)-methyltransferase [Methanobrevibacter]MCQ2971096.1 precorrin-2 C(20)-methyltransferase [archaeon]OEC95829.1 precorrin-2 C(20)-methyltransferase [Methanobrevibacter sp. A27]RPF52915.1 precorrin-2/cobalt-factor-2 C20-methyltransferase [Methanobrevibacter gottschalkii DSM 11977]SEK78168.1 precorrin-2/cobalt-factor-2 C20-methyltransferase [Methanobrevibacter gottschalkii]